MAPWRLAGYIFGRQASGGRGVGLWTALTGLTVLTGLTADVVELVDSVAAVDRVAGMER